MQGSDKQISSKHEAFKTENDLNICGPVVGFSNSMDKFSPLDQIKKNSHQQLLVMKIVISSIRIWDNMKIYEMKMKILILFKTT